MVNSVEFRNAIKFINKVSKNDLNVDDKIHLAHLKILHRARFEGTGEQKAALTEKRERIISLNAAMRQKCPLNETPFQMAIPLTRFESMLETATRIPRIVIAVLLEILLLPGALLMILAAAARIRVDPLPSEVNKMAIPILLLHGSGFNEMEWVVGRQFLKKQGYGSVFSLNYDGIVSNDPTKGIEDYAQEKISAKIKQIQQETGQDKVILIGHSMGGLIAGYYAEFLADADQIKVEHVISIASPWQGAPLIDAGWKLGGCFSYERETKRYQQMSVRGGSPNDPGFRKTLVRKATESDREGRRKYYSIWSTTDGAVPSERGRLTEDPRRQRRFQYLGHNAQAASPILWKQVLAWLNPVYGIQPAEVQKGGAFQPALGT